MKWLPLGDAALVCETGRAASLARRLRENSPPGCLDVVSSYDQLAIFFEPEDGGTILDWLKKEPLSETADPPRREYRIPVCYDPEFIEPIAEQLGLSVEEVISLHHSARYRVAAVGFSPGFPYLTGLPKQLALPRRATPVKLPAGSVAIAAEQAGIYPTDSLGGWHSLGRTDVALFDGTEAALEPGDEVIFYPAEISLPEPRTDTTLAVEDPALEILTPGNITTVQDLGRAGHRHLGVTAGGVANPEAAAATNLLVGNSASAPLLEFCLQGPSVRFLKDACIAIHGMADSRVGSPQFVHAGDTLNLVGRPTSSYGYLAIAGGFKAREFLGSASTDVRAGLGRVLKKGDLLDRGTPTTPSPLLSNQRVYWPHPKSYLEIRVLPGLQEDWFSSLAEFYEELFEKSAHFDRTGARLDGPSLSLHEKRELRSQPIAPGAIQVPPSGQPIVLTAECQTIGGYPVIAHVISADLATFSRALPGTVINFKKVTLAEARAAHLDRQQELALLKTGLELLKK